MNAKNNQRVRLTKRLFHESMLCLLNKESVDKVTVKELCDQAELNRTTFYLHYNSPEAILLEMETELVEDTQKYLSEIRNDANTLELLVKLLEYIKENRSEFDALLFKPGRDPYRQQFFEKVFPFLLPKFETKIEKKIRTYVNSYLTSGAFAVVYTWSLNNYVLSSEEVAEMVYTLSKSAMKPYVKKGEK